MKIKKLYLFSIIFLISSCGFIEPDIKDYMKCGYVAGQLQQDQAVDEITNAMQIYIQENRISINSLYLSAIPQSVQDDLGLYSLGRTGKLNKLLEVYNSSTCQSMHKQGKVTMNMYN